jgi:dTDP-glucose 4,6-dehydratase
MADVVLVTGGAGFIGSNLVLKIVKDTPLSVVNLDLLTYAANPSSLESIQSHRRYRFVRGDIGDRELVARLLSESAPIAIVNLAAETHVDRSILGPDAFVRTNVLGTFHLLDETLRWWRTLSRTRAAAFRFLHISTDEVFGSLGPSDQPFTEQTAYAPNSPYSASKAASDHFVRAYHATYGLPTLITNCSNNYGPRQFPEKLIPLMILNALAQRPLPLYGDGLNRRDWLFVEDHCAALLCVLRDGAVGETYNIGGGTDVSNIQIVQMICDCLDTARPRDSGRYRQLITYVADRPGHDRRYAVDASRIARQLGWAPEHDLEAGLAQTIQWYLRNSSWVERILSEDYSRWIELNYSQRSPQ